MHCSFPVFYRRASWRTCLWLFWLSSVGFWASGKQWWKGERGVARARFGKILIEVAFLLFLLLRFGSELHRNVHHGKKPAHSSHGTERTSNPCCVQEVSVVKVFSSSHNAVCPPRKKHKSVLKNFVLFKPVTQFFFFQGTILLLATQHNKEPNGAMCEATPPPPPPQKKKKEFTHVHAKLAENNHSCWLFASFLTLRVISMGKSACPITKLICHFLMFTTLAGSKIDQKTILSQKTSLRGNLTHNERG